MSYLILVTYDLHDAHPNDYPPVQRGLRTLGLRPTIPRPNGGEIRLPANTVGAIRNARSAAYLRDRLRVGIERVFNGCAVSGLFFIGVGSRWAWAKRRV